MGNSIPDPLLSIKFANARLDTRFINGSVLSNTPDLKLNDLDHVRFSEGLL